MAARKSDRNARRLIMSREINPIESMVYDVSIFLTFFFFLVFYTFLFVLISPVAGLIIAILEIIGDVKLYYSRL